MSQLPQVLYYIRQDVIIMNKIVIGKYVTTHGIKGEIRIKSDFNEKDQ